MSEIQWLENPAFDAPGLKSPQPCIHGAGCVYTKKTADGKVVPGVCVYVHPGEEGTGRRLFYQPRRVRLTGNALYYDRMRRRMPWQAFCAMRGIPFTPNAPGVYHQPVKRVPMREHEDSSYYDNCDLCGKPVEDCPERGDHGDELRDLAYALSGEY